MLSTSTRGRVDKYIYNIITLTPRHNCCRFADDIFKYIFLNENVCISLRISLKFVPKIWINNIASLVQIMAWRWPGDELVYEPMMVSLLILRKYASFVLKELYLFAQKFYMYMVKLCDSYERCVSIHVLRIYANRLPSSKFSNYLCLNNTVLCCSRGLIHISHTFALVAWLESFRKAISWINVIRKC